MASSPVALIIGAGPNIGAAVAKAFAAKGYRIALAARKLNDGVSEKGELHVKVDLSDPESVPGLFRKVKEKLGLPSVVVYNAAAFHSSSSDPLSAFSLPKFNASFTVNTTAAILSMQESVKAFRQLQSGSKTFIFTGNVLNEVAMPAMMDFGMGKQATAYAIRCASEAYKGEGMSFYYADERTSEGKPVYNAISGEAAAVAYVDLAEREQQGNWSYLFAKEKGELKL